ncbi:hypothetical protein EJB05_19476, partial [Eragrostis curvula]
MARAAKLQERVPLRRTAWKLADLVVLSLLLALVAHRAASLLDGAGEASWCWIAALVCETWFALLWLLNMNCKWNPVRFETHPDLLDERVDELPAVDVFVTTADPKLEPPVVTVNTVLSLLAVDYPSEYEKLVSRIENAEEGSLVFRDGEFAEFLGAERSSHPSIIKILWDSSKRMAREGFPSLIYISREKSPRYHHHFKAGAMNVMVILHAVCLLLGFDNEVHSGFVQAPQIFYGALKDDPFGNQTEVMYKKLGYGFAGLQGIYYNGTGCFHRRKVIYGVPPNCTTNVKPRTKDSLSYKELEMKFGSQEELIKSVRSVVSGDILIAPITDLSSRIEAAKEVSVCSYEIGTRWGHEIGWVYGSTTEDILTGQRIHAAGWKSALLNPDPPAFLGSAPTGGPASLTQYKRWATGLLEILMSQNNPILLSIFKRLQSRQCLAYLVIGVWPLRAPFELCYSLLGPYCLLGNRSFLPKASEPGFSIPLALFLTYNIYNFMEYMDCRLSARAWWNNQRMQRIISSSAWLLAFLTVLLKTVGLSETVFEVTRKDTSEGEDGTSKADQGRFTFDSSPVFIPVTALAILNTVAIAVGTWRALVADAAQGVPGGPGVGEFVCCSWLVLCFWPIVAGLVGNGSYGIPWSVKAKAGLLVAGFVHFCRRY